MNELLTYHLESAIVLALIYLVYRAFLRNETFFTLNRFVLLSSLPLAFTLPLLDISVGSSAVGAAPQVFTMPVVNVAEVPVQASSSESSASPLLFVYLAGVTLFLLHALYGFVSIFRLKRKAKEQVSDEGRIFFVDKGHSFSFFRMIFLNRKHHSTKDLEQIKAHEQVHVRQYHSVDALLIHLAIIFQWFNPFVWLLKYAIYENHEFIADRETSHQASDYKYQDLMLKQAAGIPLSTLVHPFNKLSLKRRFKMLLKNQSNKRNLLKYMLLIPVAGVLFWGISCNNEMGENSPQGLYKGDSVFKRVDVHPSYKDGKQALMKYFDENLVYPAEAKENNIEGTVWASFVVNKDGTVTDIEIFKELGYGCDQVVEETLKGMKWNPGKKDGKIVRTKMLIPVKFSPDEKPQSMLASRSAQPVFSDTLKFAQNKNSAKKPQNKNRDYFVVVDQQPQFPGGEDARMQYLINNIEYPQEAQDEGIEGTVYVQFIIEADGSITNVNVLRGIGGGCDEEAREVVENMPNWEPGKKDGEPVRTQFNMPIRFTLSDDGGEE